MEIVSYMEKTQSKNFLKKLLQQLQEHLPGRRVFFIYTHRNGFDRFACGLKANTEISYWSYTALCKAFPRVTFLRMEKEKAARLRTIGPEDIVIGHPGETFVRASERTRRLIAFHPWAGHEDRSENTLYNCLSKEQELNYWEKAVSIILLTSEYNKREYIEKPRNFWFDIFQQLKKPVYVVHQPIDLSLFRRIKHTYETSNFLYIGNDAHMKCLHDTKKLIKELGRALTIYGVKEKPLNNLNPSMLTSLSSQADFFIQPGMWEAQCVSILEAAARGFIPVVSPETGYPYDHPFLLRYNDFSYNMRVLKELLHTSPEERKSLADTLYNQLAEDVNHNNWERLTHVIVQAVNALYTSF